MTFEPWKQMELVADDRLAINIQEPPCKNCAFWRPRIRTHENGDYDGVVLCANIGEQCNDFSCFREKPESEAGDRLRTKGEK